MNTLNQVHWGHIWKRTVEKSQKFESVTMHLFGKVLWKYTWKRTLIWIYWDICSYQNQWECHIGCICFIFSTVGFQMSPQMALEDALTLVNLFSFLHFQMNHQLTARFDWICFLFHHSLLCFQMQPVWWCILFCRGFENTFDKTQWKKDIEVQTIYLCILLEKCFEVTFENTQWKKVEQMQPMRLCLFTGRQFESTFENT